MKTKPSLKETVARYIPKGVKTLSKTNKKELVIVGVFGAFVGALVTSGLAFIFLVLVCVGYGNELSAARRRQSSYYTPPRVVPYPRAEPIYTPTPERCDACYGRGYNKVNGREVICLGCCGKGERGR